MTGQHHEAGRFDLVQVIEDAGLMIAELLAGDRIPDVPGMACQEYLGIQPQNFLDRFPLDWHE